MTISLDHRDSGPGEGHAGDFRHEAFFYAGSGDFLRGTAAFVEDGLRAGEPVMVALPTERLELLRAALGDDARRVLFADMLDIGRNPGRIIPAWRRFVNDNAGRPFRGIGEPIWSGRNRAELVECQLHEVLLNVAFDGVEQWRLLCPYDVESLADDILAEARRSHPYVLEPDGPRPSEAFETRAGPDLLHGHLPEPSVVATEVVFDASSLSRVRVAVARLVAGALPATRTAELLLAAHEVAANSVLHGGGSGRLRCWIEDGTITCEVRDAGRVREELVGRALPPGDNEFGRGLWLAHQLCDLVQLRSSDEGTVVRLSVSAEGPSTSVG